MDALHVLQHATRRMNSVVLTSHACTTWCFASHHQRINPQPINQLTNQSINAKCLSNSKGGHFWTLEVKSPHYFIISRRREALLATPSRDHTNWRIFSSHLLLLGDMLGYITLAFSLAVRHHSTPHNHAKDKKDKTRASGTIYYILTNSLIKDAW